jgi:hypothetical protein
MAALVAMRCIEQFSATHTTPCKRSDKNINLWFLRIPTCFSKGFAFVSLSETNLKKQVSPQKKGMTESAQSVVMTNELQKKILQHLVA